jgi:hypothetical protein
VPAADARTVREGRSPLAEAEGVRLVRQEADSVVVAIGSACGTTPMAIRPVRYLPRSAAQSRTTVNGTGPPFFTGLASRKRRPSAVAT